GFFIKIIKCSEPTREKFAIDDAFRETLHRSEAHSLRQLIDPVADQTLVSRRKRRKSIPHDNPVSELSIDQSTLTSRLAHHFGIVALARDGEIGWIESGQDVEIQEAVIERRYQSI